MPYITTEDRKKFDPIVDLMKPIIDNVGELNYIITRLAHNYIKFRGINYKNLSAVGGVLADTRDEFYRTIVTPYEIKKADDNGKIGVLEIESEE